MKMSRFPGAGRPNGPLARVCVVPKSGELRTPLGVPRLTMLKMFRAPAMKGKAVFAGNGGVEFWCCLIAAEATSISASLCS